MLYLIPPSLQRCTALSVMKSNETIESENVCGIFPMWTWDLVSKFTFKRQWNENPLFQSTSRAVECGGVDQPPRWNGTTSNGHMPSKRGKRETWKVMKNLFLLPLCLVWLTKHVRVTTGWIECGYFEGNETQQRRREQIFKLNNWKHFYFFHLICLTLLPLLFLSLFFLDFYSSWRWWVCVLFFSFFPSIKITKFWLTLTWWNCELLLDLHEMLGFRVVKKHFLMNKMAAKSLYNILLFMMGW